MELYNDKLKHGSYLTPSQLQTDLKTVSKTVTSLEGNVKFLVSSVQELKDNKTNLTEYETSIKSILTSIDMIKKIIEREDSKVLQNTLENRKAIEELIKSVLTLENKKSFWTRIKNFFKKLFGKK